MPPNSEQKSNLTYLVVALGLIMMGVFDTPSPAKPRFTLRSLADFISTDIFGIRKGTQNSHLTTYGRNMIVDFAGGAVHSDSPPQYGEVPEMEPNLIDPPIGQVTLGSYETPKTYGPNVGAIDKFGSPDVLWNWAPSTPSDLFYSTQTDVMEVEPFYDFNGGEWTLDATE